MTQNLYDQLGIAAPASASTPVAPVLPPPPTIKPVNDPITAQPKLSVVFTETDVEGMAREATPMAFQELVNIGMGCYPNVDEKVRVVALKEILDRGLGKAIQQTKVTVTHEETVKQLQQAFLGRTIDVEPNSD